MKGNYLKCVTGALVLAMLGGCASTSDGRLTQAQGTGIGAGLGALLAGGITALAGGSGNQIARNAAIGAGVGGLAGFAYGTEIAKRKRAYANNEAWIRAEISKAQEANDEIIAYNQSLESKVTRLEQRTRLAQQSGNKAELREIKQEVAALSQEANQKESSFQQQAKMTAEMSRDKDAQATGQAQSLSSLANSMQSNTYKVSTTSRRLATLNNQISL